ncbi:MAG: glycosyltransferase family 87 protein [Isosphaeraceae bacterium]|nr:glycosyltransferase family 87 protein [Isosphaeraceae bacterium]
MPTPDTGVPPDFDRHFRRLVWFLFGVIMIVAAVMYGKKADDDRSAFIRWRPQVLQFWQGVNIYDVAMFPNPPIMPITLYPFMRLPKIPGALCWFGFKVVLTLVSIWLCYKMARADPRPFPSWAQAGILVFSLRPILGDLHHGNNNLLILFLIVSALYAWREGYDVLAGFVLALAISYKVTPALFVPYFMYKRSWRTVGATCLGIGVFLLVVPSLIIGPQFNGECLMMWWHRMLSPYVSDGVASPQEVNQSMVGVLTRLLTETGTGAGRYEVHLDVNLVAWPAAAVSNLIKVLSVAFVGLLAIFCRTKTDRRTDPRLLGEFALVVLTMLFVSERSWKHHFVTLLIPYTYLMARFLNRKLPAGTRVTLALAMWFSVFLMATTSSEVGGILQHGQGHKYAQAYGMFFVAGLVVYAATAWQVVAARREGGNGAEIDRELEVPAPHFTAASRAAAPREA